ncbi:MAG: helix-turn-helix domain-containing protein [Actinomycetota bacterium]|nr:helix-turn-helix domain-containing protein [Actinomycetota bacterium]
MNTRQARRPQSCRIREGRGYSLEAFADLISVHRTYLGGLERGERNPTLRSVERIAGWLQLPPLVLASRAVISNCPAP